MRFNDGRCDRQGRFWAGSMLLDMQQGAHVARCTGMTAKAICTCSRTA
jgi:sugar lactone lactonase YvrE